MNSMSASFFCIFLVLSFHILENIYENTPLKCLPVREQIHFLCNCFGVMFLLKKIPFLSLNYLNKSVLVMSIHWLLLLCHIDVKIDIFVIFKKKLKKQIIKKIKK